MTFNLRVKIMAVSGIALTLLCCRNPVRSYLGEESARRSLHEVLSDSTDRRLPQPLIPDEITATGVAEAVLFKIYGEETIKDERPYETFLIDGYWVIRGTIPRGFVGGGFEIMIDSKDGRVIHLTHYK